MEILIKNGSLLTLGEQKDDFYRGSILLRDGRIAALGPREDFPGARPEQVIDAAGRLVMPGLVNSDLHAAEILERGLPARRPHSLDPEQVHAAALQAGAEQLRGGVTAFQDHWTFGEAGLPSGLEPAVCAYTQLGLRATLAVELQTDDPKRAIEAYEAALARWNGAEKGRIRIGIAPGKRLWKDPKFAGWLREMLESGLPTLHFHFNRTRSEVDQERQENAGRSAIEQAGQLGLLGPRTTVSHAVWVTHAELDLLAQSRTTVIHTLLSDLSMGYGVLPAHRYQAAGVNLVLGSGSGSGGNVNMFDALKLAASIHRIYQPDYRRWPTVEQVLNMATRNNQATGLYDGPVGRLETGAQGDLALIDLQTVAFSPLNQVKSQLVCLEDGRSVDMALVGGEVVLEAGRPRNVDEAVTEATIGRER